MSEFYVGQKVVCVDNRQTNPPNTLVKGEVYTIRALGPYEWQNPQPELGLTPIWIAGILRLNKSGSDVPFGDARFRPLESKSISLFRRIAQGVTDGKPVVSDPEFDPALPTNALAIFARRFQQ